ncbi:MAG: sugar transferase [Thermoguttaceae bacterium]|nr:sugar transferase [Thermoguttaceae bacterium]MDW8079038.1 sugar transferase [Thermoguttaceae bacterium]
MDVDYDQGLSTNFPYPVRSYPGKRLLDVILAVLGLLILSPLFLLAALAVRLSSPGPIFYRGLRAGLRGRPFWQLKFRTMRVDHDRRPFTGKEDPRVTTVGRVLRLFRIDELPQLINILRGEMSWVGPRPEELSVVKRCYTREQLRVLSARPGLTGTVQVKYFPGLEFCIPPGVDPQEYYEKVLLPRRLEEDLQYVDRMSLLVDIWVLIRTLYCIFVKSWFFLLAKVRSADVSVGQTGGPASLAEAG